VQRVQRSFWGLEFLVYSFRVIFLVINLLRQVLKSPFHLFRKPLTYEIEEHDGMPGINKWGSGQDEDDTGLRKVDEAGAEDVASSDHSPFYPDPLRTDPGQQPCAVSPQNPAFRTSSPTSRPSSPPQPSTSPSTSDNVGGGPSDRLPDNKPPPVIPEEVLRQRIEQRVQKETEEKAKTSFGMRQVLKDRDDFRDRLSVAFALLEYLEEFQQRLRNNPEEFYCSVELHPNPPAKSQ